MNQKEFEHAVATHDERMINAMIDRIPYNVNRAGKRYKELADNIKKNYYAARKTSRQLRAG